MDPNNWLVVGERIEDLETMIISTWNDSEFQRSWWKIERNVEKKITVIKKLHDSHNDKLKGISTVWVNSHLYCTGGKNALGICSNQAMSYNFLEEDWNKAHDLDIPRSDHVSLSLKISESYVFGGNQEKFASRFSTTKHGGEEIGFSINNPQSFGDEVESFALHFIKKKQHDAVAYFWMPRGEGFNVVQYTFASRRWDLIPSDSGIALKRPLNFESPRIGQYFLSVVDGHIWCFHNDEKKWYHLYKLSVQPEAKRRVHLVHLGDSKLCILYMDLNNQLFCFYFRFNGSTRTLRQDGGAIFSFEDGCELATVSFVSKDDARKKRNKEEDIMRFSVKVKREDKQNQFSIDLEENKSWIYSSPMSLIGNNDSPHKVFHHKKVHKNVLSHIFHYEDPSGPCINEGWGKSLDDIVTGDDSSKVFWELVPGQLNTYTMSSTFLTIVRGILKGLCSFSEQEIGVQKLTETDIVFRRGDDKYETPLLIDCNIVGEQNHPKNLEVLASLITSIANKHKIAPVKDHKTGEKKAPNVELFVDYLQNYCSKADKALLHPIFLTDAEKVDYLVRIRDKIRQHFNLGIHVCELYEPEVGKKHDWRTFLALKDASVFRTTYSRLQDGNRTDGYFESVETFVIFLRNAYVHANDSLSTTDPMMTITRFGKLLQEVCPALLPVVFRKHGNLLT